MKSDYLKPELYGVLEKVMQRENVLAMRVAVETGLRIDDVLRLRWSDFRRGGWFEYVAKKTGKKGRKHITKGLKAELFARREESEYVFPGRKRGRHRTRQAVWKDMVQACDKMGITQNGTPHSARKTYAVQLRKEAGLAAVQKELQHTSSTTTMIYAFADMARAANASYDPCAFAELVAQRVVEKLAALLPEGCPIYGTVKQAARKEKDHD